MKSIIILLTITLSLFASTKYKTPNMVVENSPMYCVDSNGENIITYNVGDIVDGKIAKERCSYNQASLERLKTERKQQIKEDEKTLKKVMTIIDVGIIMIIFVLLYFYIYPKIKRKLQNKENS